MKYNKQDENTIIDEAVLVFGAINRKIKSLIDCSSKDFDTLSQSFREYHTIIKNLSEKASLLFTSASDLETEAIEKLINEVDAIFSKYKMAFSDLVEIERYMISLMNNTSYSFIYFNNLKQNISTLKLLTTNIQLEPNYRKLYTNLIKTIDSLSDCCLKFDCEFQSSLKQLEEGFEIIDQIKNMHFSAILLSIEKLHKNLVELEHKKLLCTGNSEVLDDLDSKKTMSSSEIITNLQFQDIVRQKIEHVQLAHEDLLNQLNKYSLDGNVDGLNLEIILQIRNIGSLQAAQLVHANSEYQKAVKNITEKFGDLDHVLNETLRLLNIFITSGDSVEEYFFKSFERNLSAYYQTTGTFKQNHFDLQNIFKEFIQCSERFYSAKSTFNSSVETINTIFEDLKKIRETKAPDKSTLDTLSQILINFDEFKNNSLNLCEIQDRNISEIRENLIPTFRNYFSNIDPIIQDTDYFVQKIKELVPAQLFGLISTRDLLNEKEIFVTKFNIKQVAYYTIFEKEVDAIISNLNQLIGKIDFSDIEVKMDENNLEELKKLYTMKSERDIHDDFTGTLEGKKESENEIELF